MLSDKFVYRHIGPREEDIYQMLKELGYGSLEDLMNDVVPADIRLKQPLVLDPPMSEYEIFNRLRELGQKNKNYRSFIGMGYYGTMMPPVIQRNVLENPNWYTSYTPYQAEISQGRLEALLIFQTMVTELTAMEVANSSLLDEATAAAEAMSMLFNLRSPQKKKSNANKFFVDKNIFPQTLAVLQTRSEPFGIELIIGDWQNFDFGPDFFGAIVQYPNSDGEIYDYSDFIEKAHQNDILVGVIADLLSLAILEPPGKWGADVVVGSTQRFGLPMGYGGPHAGYFATRLKYVRKMPGRIIGVTKDRFGNKAYRMTLQTREQHIKRERATSNICTAQALMAILSAFYAVYHGPNGLKRIAFDIHSKTATLDIELKKLGYHQLNKNYFDTLKIKLPADVSQHEIKAIALQNNVNLRYFDDGHVGISLDEVTTIDELNRIITIFAQAIGVTPEDYIKNVSTIETFDSKFLRSSEFMQQPIFNSYHSETEMMRYIKRLERKDISLAQSMIPLGSCTMKLNSAVSMFALSDPNWANIHPFVPKFQAEGYEQLIAELRKDLRAITGYADICFQPNSGAAGEYTGLMVIRKYHQDHGQPNRNVMLIPASAHGTNPASAAMAGMKIVVVKTDENGNIDIDDLQQKAQEHKDNLAGFMVTYPSTHGVFEEKIKQMCDIIHQYGGLVYMDGANLNAQIGYTNPVVIGADIGHLNLHKTFAMPHGGGGPGVGPIGVTQRLKPYLPSHPVVDVARSDKAIPAVAAAPYGSPLLLTIAYAYIKMMGAQGLKRATEVAVLNANYVAKKLDPYFPIVYKGERGLNAHEAILDIRPYKHSLGITEIDVAKRLIDFGFHAPTVSFPVVGGLMVEPTESESKQELDRFIQAMKQIYQEIMAIKEQKFAQDDNPLKNAPHPDHELAADDWTHKYSRSQAAYPLDFVRKNKLWFSVGRVDEAWGDRHLILNFVTDQEWEQLKDNVQKR